MYAKRISRLWIWWWSWCCSCLTSRGSNLAHWLAAHSIVRRVQNHDLRGRISTKKTQPQDIMICGLSMITLLKFNLYLIEPRVEKDVDVDGEQRIRASKFLIQNNALEGSTIVIRWNGLSRLPPAIRWIDLKHFWGEKWTSFFSETFPLYFAWRNPLYIPPQWLRNKRWTQICEKRSDQVSMINGQSNKRFSKLQLESVAFI